MRCATVQLLSTARRCALNDDGELSEVSCTRQELIYRIQVLVPRINFDFYRMYLVKKNPPKFNQAATTRDCYVLYSDLKVVDFLAR